MPTRDILDGLIMYLGLVILLTFHEFGHAWMAWRCGDDTARSQGRVSLNPLMHIDPIGTVVMPLLQIFMPGAGRFLVGWARPVPVNLYNLRNPRVDDILVTLAGPWMNLLLAIVLVGLARVGLLVNSESLFDESIRFAHLSLLLCFFNLLPIPPLDGSRVVRNVLKISYEDYNRVAQFGFFILIIVWQIPIVNQTISNMTTWSLDTIAAWFGIPLGL
jgi:Zn-dependent protease